MLPTRWVPSRGIVRLERVMDHLMREPVASFRRWPTLWDGRPRPSLDVYETPDQVVAKAALPGISSEEVEVTIAKDTLVIRGESKQEGETKDERYLLRERGHGAFHRAVYLPEGLDTDKTEAVFEDGVLTITFPKTEKAKAKEVKVEVKEAPKSKKA